MTEPPARLARLRPDLAAMHAYAVQDSAGLVKLDAMENPHRLPAGLQAELGRRLGAVALNRYPGAQIESLKRRIAAHAAMPEGFSLTLGNGSDELISLLAMAVDIPGAAILSPLPGFVMYAISARAQGVGFVEVPLAADFELDVPAMRAAIAEHRPALTYLAYPNNPTATLWSDDAMDAVVDACADAGGLVVIDEAYQPFAARSWLDRAARHDHVLVMRTLSKFGLAGVRIGYLMGPSAIVGEIDKLRPPYNVSVLNAECALFALEHAAVFEAQAADIRARRAELFAALQAMPGVERAWPSEANMILVRVADSARVWSGMKARGVLVKNVSTMHPQLAQCLRLTVGTEGENRAMLGALAESLDEIR